MPPENTLPLPSEPAPLPPAQPTVAMPQAFNKPASTQPKLSPTQTTVSQAKQLVGQYRANPYQLSLALQQLKMHYLATQFSITTDPSHT